MAWEGDSPLFTALTVEQRQTFLARLQGSLNLEFPHFFLFFCYNKKRVCDLSQTDVHRASFLFSETGSPQRPSQNACLLFASPSM
jgi:hypothetical protein